MLKTAMSNYEESVKTHKTLKQKTLCTEPNKRAMLTDDTILGVYTTAPGNRTTYNFPNLGNREVVPHTSS